MSDSKTNLSEEPSDAAKPPPERPPPPAKVVKEKVSASAESMHTHSSACGRQGTNEDGCSSTSSDENLVCDANIVGNKAVVFSLHNQVGGLVRALRIFQELGVNVKHIESRKSKRNDSEFEIYVDIDCDDMEKMSSLVHNLRHEVDGCTLEEFERSKRRSTSDSQTAKPTKKLLLTQPSVDNGLFIFEQRTFCKCRSELLTAIP